MAVQQTFTQHPIEVSPPLMNLHEQLALVYLYVD